METTPKMGHAVDIAWGLIYKCMKTEFSYLNEKFYPMNTFAIVKIICWTEFIQINLLKLTLYLPPP